jgi:hypothetical protein
MFAAALGGASLLAGFGAAAQAASGGSFPDSLDRDVLIAWLRAETNLAPSAVVSVKPADLIGIASLQPLDIPGAVGQFHVQIRAEVISPQIVAQAQRRSWAAEVDVDCKGSQAKVRQILDYPQRNLKGEAREASTSAQWISPSPGAHLYNLISAVCDENYHRPLSPPVVPTPAVTPAPILSAPRPLPGGEAISTAVGRPVPAAPAPRAPEPAPMPVQAPVAAEPTLVRGARVQTAVQLGAADSDQKAQDLLAATRRQHAAQMQGLETKAVRVVVSGKVYYRALVAGFGSQAEAETLCRSIKAGGKDCLIRRDGGLR